MSVLTGSLLLIILALTATCLVLLMRGNVHKYKRKINAEWALYWRNCARDAEAIINAPCVGCGEAPATAQAAQAEVQRIEAERAEEERAELEAWWSL